MVTRQTLARYAFFEDARGSTNHSEDALIPLVLPSIAGREGKIFSPEELGRDLAEVFGPDLAASLAGSLVDPLLRQGYLRREVSAEDGAIYVYTQKLREIPLQASISRAEADVDQIYGAFQDYLAVTPQLAPIMETNPQLRDQLINWMTTVEATDLVDVQFSAVGLDSRSVGTTNSMPSDTVSGLPERLRLLFSSFVSWLSREREATFDKVLIFVELGLIIDLVSEIRVPTRRSNRVQLTVILDTRLVMELVGLYGPQAKESIQRLMELCKKYGVTVITLVHLVDEMSEITYNTLLNLGESSPGSVGEAIRKHPEVLDILRSVHKSPDRYVRDAGISIYQYTQTPNVNANRLFTVQQITEFQDFLPYDKSKPNMAKRDAWSLAHAVRRQNGCHTSNVYEARCLILTRSFPFVTSAKKYLKSDAVGYPNYAVAPIMELRHFSTMFMLSFGVGVARPVIRAELVASCDRIIRVSPNLTRRIRSVLSKIEVLSQEQLEAALADPNTMTEFALVTGNDPSLVTDQNSAAFLDVIRNVATKDAELRHRAVEAAREAKHRAELEVRDELIAAEKQERNELAAALKRQADEVAEVRRDSSRRDDLSVLASTNRIHREVSLYWFLVLTLAAGAGLGFLADYLFHITGLSTPVQIGAATVLGGVAFYMTMATFVPRIAPDSLRRLTTRLVARRQLKGSLRPDLNARVLAHIDREQALKMPTVLLAPDSDPRGANTRGE